MGQGDPGGQHQGAVRSIRAPAKYSIVPFREVDGTLLHRTVFRRPATGMGQIRSPRFSTAMEELASTPDAKAHNRYASL
jgi:hypothetical protein